MFRNNRGQRSAARLLSMVGGGGGGEFSDWPFEELSLRLSEDGVDVPPDTNPHDLALFAEAFYADRPERPKRYSVHGVEFVDSNGVEYVPRPRRKPQGGEAKHPHPHPHHHANHRASQVSTEEKHAEPDAVADDAVRPVPLNGQAQSEFATAVNDVAPPMFESEMNDAERQHYQALASSLSAKDLGALQVEEEDAQHFADESPDTAEIRDMFKFINEEDATEDRIRNEFQRPSQALAQRYADLNHPRRENGKRYDWLWTNTGRFCFSRGFGCCVFFDPFKEGSNSELAKFGVGISLYFKTLKWMFWTFFIMFIVTLPQLVINAQGVQTAAAQNFIFTSTSLGHVAQLSYYVNASLGANATIERVFTDEPVLLPMLTCGGAPAGQCYVSRNTLGVIYTSLDLAAIAVFVLSCRWLRYFTLLEGAKITKHHITAEEYTVQIVRVPPDSSEMQLKRFFSDVTGEPVHDVNLVQDNGKLLNLYVQRGKLVNKLWKQAARVHLIKAERRMKPGAHMVKDDALLEKALTHARDKYDQLYAKFLNLNEQRNRLNAGNVSLSAFVTFETQQGFLKCLDLYPSTWSARRKQPSELRLGPKPLKVRQAPPPSTILWENTHVKWSQRRWRRYFTMFATGVALIVTVVSVFFISKERNNLSQSLSSEQCTVLTDILNGALNVTGLELPAGGNLTYFAQTLEQAARREPATVATVRGNAALLSCYCSQLTFDEISSAIWTRTDLCHAYFVDKTPLYILSFLATIVVSIINIGIQYIIMFLSRFERHHSLVNMEFSIARRVFVVLMGNTGLIILGVNAAFPGAIWIGSGRYSDFTPDWYGYVGMLITITMIINVITPHFFPILNYFFFRYQLMTKVAYSQRELNELNLGPVFFLAYRVAQQLMTIFVTMLFSAGIPALYPIACCMFFVNFYVDKYLLFNFYRTPPAYSERLMAWSSDTISYASIGHLAFAVWMYSARGIFWSSNTAERSYIASELGLTQIGADEGFLFSERLGLNFIVPLYIALLVVVVLKVLGFFFTSVDRVRAVLCATVTCGIFDDGTIKRRYLNPDYSEAVENHELRGLVNYNMLENPYYARLLGIDSKFGREHKHIASVHEASAIQLPLMPKSFHIAPMAVVEEEARARAASSSDADEVDNNNSINGEAGDGDAPGERRSRPKGRESVGRGFELREGDPGYVRPKSRPMSAKPRVASMGDAGASSSRDRSASSTGSRGNAGAGGGGGAAAVAPGDGVSGDVEAQAKPAARNQRANKLAHAFRDDPSLM